jgi:hypothetical protein
MTLNGLEAAISGLDNLNAQMQQEVQQVIETHTQGTFDDSQDIVPVLTGDLRDSGSVDIQPMQGTITYDADYAVWVNDGHHTRSGSFVPPTNFLTDPFNAHAQQFESDMQEGNHNGGYDHQGTT